MPVFFMFFPMFFCMFFVLKILHKLYALAVFRNRIASALWSEAERHIYGSDDIFQVSDCLAWPPRVIMHA